ncbi:multifunctional CCA addition/repair protein [Vibrio parahaemolyticus]
MRKVYLVGGAVRDTLLGIEPKDRDFAVTGASVEDMLNDGFVNVGKAFPVFLKDGCEYALARTEKKSGTGYHGFIPSTSPEISIEQDLFRRDLTINAIAQDLETGELIDPYGGKKDIEARLLRHVSTAFTEDPLRVLRVARFLARYAHLGFTVAPETLYMMKKVVSSGELTTISPERIWSEIKGALETQSPHKFFLVLKKVGALKEILPEVDRLFGVRQRREYHPEVDTGIHVMMALQQSVKLTTCSVTRFGVLVHDLGKGLTPKDILPRHHMHEIRGVPLVDDICDRLRVPKKYRTFGKIASEFHTHSHEAFLRSPSTFIKFFYAIDAIRNPKNLEMLAICGEADSRGRTGFEEESYPQRDYLMQVLKLAKKADLSKIDKKSKHVEQQVLEARIRAIKPFVSEHKIAQKKNQPTDRKPK